MVEFKLCTTPVAGLKHNVYAACEAPKLLKVVQRSWCEADLARSWSSNMSHVTEGATPDISERIVSLSSEQVDQVLLSHAAGKKRWTNRARVESIDLPRFLQGSNNMAHTRHRCAPAHVMSAFK